MSSVHVSLLEPRPPDALGLLVPLPPDTSHQTFRSLRLSRGWLATEVRACDGSQRALYAHQVPAEGEFKYAIALVEQAAHLEQFTPQLNRFTAAPSALVQLVQGAVSGVPDTTEVVRRVVDLTARRFRYGPRSPNETPTLCCDVMVGNCIDINTFFVAALRAAGVPCAYYAGYWFQHGQPVADGMHCWVTTIEDGQHRSWDIAHHLKRGIVAVEPGLNPVAGVRVAMSWGRGLRFIVAGRELELSHLAQPQWVHESGATSLALVRAELRSILADHSVSPQLEERS